jgi:hypothetical protein
MLPLPAIGLGIGLIGGIGKMIGRGKANRTMQQLMKENPAYQENPLARQRLALAQTLFNARTPGAAQAERNIFSNQANTVANINRNATDSSQALALATGAQGQTNNDIMQLGQMEAQDGQRRYGNLAGAQQGMIGEQDKLFQDKVRRFQDKAQISGAINENRQNGWGDISNLGFGMMNFGLAGGFDNMFGGGKMATPLHDSKYSGVFGSPVPNLPPQ